MVVGSGGADDEGRWPARQQSPAGRHSPRADAHVPLSNRICQLVRVGLFTRERSWCWPEDRTVGGGRRASAAWTVGDIMVRLTSGHEGWTLFFF